MKFLSADELERVASFSGLINALREGHRSPPPLTHAAQLQDPTRGSPNRFNVLSAWAGGRHIGSKLVSVFAENDSRGSGLPSVQGVYVLFEAINGAPTLVVDGASLTLWKTAADSALGASYLAPADAKTLLMVGAGALAPYVIAAYRSVRPSIERVLVWNRRPERAVKLARLRDQDLDIRAVVDLEAAVRESEIVACATMSSEPLVKGCMASARITCRSHRRLEARYAGGR